MNLRFLRASEWGPRQRETQQEYLADYMQDIENEKEDPQVLVWELWWEAIVGVRK